MGQHFKPRTGELQCIAPKICLSLTYQFYYFNCGGLQPLEHTLGNTMVKSCLHCSKVTRLPATYCPFTKPPTLPWPASKGPWQDWTARFLWRPSAGRTVTWGAVESPSGRLAAVLACYSGAAAPHPGGPQPSSCPVHLERVPLRSPTPTSPISDSTCLARYLTGTGDNIQPSLQT